MQPARPPADMLLYVHNHSPSQDVRSSTLSALRRVEQVAPSLREFGLRIEARPVEPGDPQRHAAQLQALGVRALPALVLRDGRFVEGLQQISEFLQGMLQKATADRAQAAARLAPLDAHAGYVQRVLATGDEEQDDEADAFANDLRTKAAQRRPPPGRPRAKAGPGGEEPAPEAGGARPPRSGRPPVQGLGRQDVGPGGGDGRLATQDGLQTLIDQASVAAKGKKITDDDMVSSMLDRLG